MSQNISFNIYVMSYKRPEVHMTDKILSYYTYVVRESEKEAYLANGHKNLLVIPKDAPVINFMDTFYWIIRNTPEQVIAILDDDLTGINIRTFENTTLEGEKGKEIATNELERVAQMISDLDLGMGISPINGALYAYRQEIEFKGIPGGIRWINKPFFKAKYDPKDPATSDTDMVLQELLYNRIVFKANWILARTKVDQGVGKNEAYDRKMKEDMFKYLAQKWGKYYRYDKKSNKANLRVER